ncbi:hypothetical protein CFP65_1597 [Kitasatospora sp. MMS16-BH015]|uniref:sensor histidine kinase n=1 Tax=Kitasatospora sp. MMS16-BH015 TaxID=2018025 RepID=UPI000CA2B07D|nr:histidine kinase [Kitasatospora sp. MMS16-BH015]AUG76485.1 hypothetical protein CFP65_1597 [Kitasatospora sp. MMS16-BH015]
MSTPTTALGLPLLRRVPPAGWVAAAWCALVLPAAPQSAGFLLVASAVAFGGAALLGRRPVLGVGLLLLATVAVTDATSAGGQLSLLSLAAVYAALAVVTARQPARRSRAAFGLVLVVLVLHLGMTADNTVGVTTSTYDGRPPAGTVFTLGRYHVTSGLPHLGASDEGVLAAVIAWLVGRSVRQAREYGEALGARRAEQAVTAERLRIAREMHDTVAHSMGVIALQAGAARLVIDSRPERAKEALGVIETAGRQTLAGMRRLVGAVREPGPGIGELAELAAVTSQAGVAVELRRVGELGGLPVETSQAVYRIAQEGVANVVRHAGVGSCRVRVELLPAGVVEVEVTDRGQGTGGPGGGGYGLIGVRERVALLGGEFEAGPQAGGGFRVAARLPVGEEAR